MSTITEPMGRFFEALERFVPWKSQNRMSKRQNELMKLLKASIDENDFDEYDDLSSVWKAYEVAFWEHVYAKEGKKIQGGWGKQKAPMARPGNQTRYQRAPFYDHAYRIRRPGGENVFVSEPYGLSTEDIKALSDLIDEGWHVSVDALRAKRNPGSTVRVALHREQFEQ